MLLICSIAVSIGVQAQPIAFAAATTLYMLLVRVPIAPDGGGGGEPAAIGIFSLIGVGATDSWFDRACDPDGGAGAGAAVPAAGAVDAGGRGRKATMT